jgi:hypothetical protein
MAMIDGRGRSSAVEAETDVRCRAVPIEGLRRLEADIPSGIASLYRNVARSLAGRLRDANDEIRALQG